MSILLLLTVLLGATCIAGDWLVSIHSETQRLRKAIADNGTHAIVGALTVFIVVYSVDRRSSNAFLMIVVGSMISSLIDLDHFIQAKSTFLSDAVHLSHRPFLHCSTIILLIVALWSIAMCTRQPFDSIMWIAVVLCAFVSHHIRDSTRRGLWFYLLGNSPPIPYVGYVCLIVAFPYVVRLLINYVISTQFSMGKQYKNIAFSTDIHDI